MNCTSCGRDARLSATVFPCPSCGQDLCRCADCKTNSNAYVCKNCNYAGP